MYRTCISCTSDLGANQVIETLPIGRRIAFDSRQGRLWVVCAHCCKWNLVPFDARLETIDDCERHFRDTSTRYSTEHIGLARLAEGMDLIRIGPALGEEFAAWRYGRAFLSRRRRHRLMAGAVGLPTGILLGGLIVPTMIFAPISLIVMSGGLTAYSLFRVGIQAGADAVSHREMRLRARTPWGSAVTLRHRAVAGASLHMVDDQLQLRLESGAPGVEEDLVFVGTEGDQLVRRILGRLNAVDGTPKEVEGALERVTWLSRTARTESILELISSVHGIRSRTDRGDNVLASFTAQDRLAYEMWGNEESERQYLAGELKLLERQWRQAEELAAIADGLAFPEDRDQRSEIGDQRDS